MREVESLKPSTQTSRTKRLAGRICLPQHANKRCVDELLGGLTDYTKYTKDNEMKHTPVISMATALIMAGCATTDGPKPEKGPAGTIAYLVEVESSEPGARIEANKEYIGKTPCVLKIFGDKDGTFHNFGSYHYTVTAYPVRAGQEPQTKDFRTGKWFTPEDKIPKKLFFDFGPVPETPKTKPK